MAAQLRQHRTDLEVADTALRQRFAELSDLKSYTDDILRSFMNGLVTLDLDGRVVTVNPAAETLIGSTATALTGRPATDVFHRVPELRDLLLDTLRTRVGVGPKGRPSASWPSSATCRQCGSWRTSSAAPIASLRWARWPPGSPTRSRTRSPPS
jgi:PAS domain-containing protein